MIVIGLTGSIGMGKTTAADMLAEMGVPVHDSDAEVHRLFNAGGQGVETVRDLFPEALEKNDAGAEVVNRSQLGAIVFSDPDKREALEAVLHPLVRQAQNAFLEKAAASGAKAAVLDIPLLFETGSDKDVDVSICMTAPAFIQRHRVLARPNMTPEKFQSILGSQMPDREKTRRADFVVQSSLGKAYTRKILSRILEQVIEKIPAQAFNRRRGVQT